MAISLEEKREIIVKNKDPVIAALNSVLDTYYDLIAPVVDDNGEIKTELFQEEKSLNFVQEIKSDTIKFEKILDHVKKNIELTKLEVAYIGVAFSFCTLRAQEQIKDLEAMIKLSKEITTQLYDPEEEQPKIVESSLANEES